jgi:hypothetical protein
MVNVIVAKTKLDCEKLLGQFVDETHYDLLVEEDTDCYMPAECVALANDCNKDCNNCESGQNELKIAFKFRKNFFSKEEQEQAYAGLRDAATLSQNRGLAAGPKGDKCLGRDWLSEVQYQTLKYLIDLKNSHLFGDIKADLQNIKEKYTDVQTTRGLVWLASELEKQKFDYDKWLRAILKETDNQEISRQADEVLQTYISDTTYANPVHSGIAGWFDRYPRIPYGRATSYTQHNYDKFKMSFPFLQSLNRGFKDLLPWRWGNQKAAADKIDSKFLVPGTVFTTVTVNKTFRTACHRDAGDFSSGLSNLLVLSNNGNYSGGYLVFPEYRIAVNVRPGDLLLVNNHEIIHGNTPIVMHDDVAERISLVCYFREKMLELGSYEYENLRYEFVESRRKNQEHELWRPLWNGVSAGMWESKEWYGYLESNGGLEMLNNYHPEANQKNASLEDLFQ